jgi:hypothetical protein
VPATSDAGGPLQVRVKPVELAVLESRTAGAAWQAQWASGYVFDPSSGAEIDPSSGAQIQRTASVSVDIGGVPRAMPWAPDLAGQSSYFAQFSPPPPAQSSYTISTSDPALGPAPLPWTLQADPPSFDGAITTPPDGATVAMNTALMVSWSQQPSADFELTQLFARDDAGGWTPVYTSPQPNDSTVTGETIPAAKLAPGKYLLNVAFAKANCPATADGCVIASAVAVAQFTAQ